MFSLKELVTFEAFGGASEQHECPDISVIHSGKSGRASSRERCSHEPLITVCNGGLSHLGQVPSCHVASFFFFLALLGACKIVIPSQELNLFTGGRGVLTIGLTGLNR